MLGRLNPASGEVKEWQTPGGAESRPYAMTRDNQDRLWFVETGPEPNRRVGFDPAESDFFSATPIPSGSDTVRHMVSHEPARSIWFGTDANTIGRRAGTRAAGCPLPLAAVLVLMPSLRDPYSTNFQYPRPYLRRIRTTGCDIIPALAKTPSALVIPTWKRSRPAELRVATSAYRTRTESSHSFSSRPRVGEIGSVVPAASTSRMARTMQIVLAGACVAFLPFFLASMIPDQALPGPFLPFRP